MHSVLIGRGDRPEIVFAHGWARSHHDFIPVAEALIAQHRSILIDLPGFGATPRPEEGWDTKQYADFAAEFIREKIGAPVVWVGHSFGDRVGMRLGVHHPEVLKGLVLVAAAGIRLDRRTAWQRLRGRWRSAEFRRLRKGAGTEEEIIAAAIISNTRRRDPTFADQLYTAKRIMAANFKPEALAKAFGVEMKEIKKILKLASVDDFSSTPSVTARSIFPRSK